MDLTLANVAMAISAGSTIIAAILVALMWRLRGEFATKGDLAGESGARAALGRHVEGINSRVVTMEAQIKAMPTHEEWSELRVLLERVNGDQKALAESVAGVSQTGARTAAAVGRIEGFFLERGISADRRSTT